MINSRIQKYGLALAIAAPTAVLAAPVDDAKAVVDGSTTVFEYAVVLGLSVLAYRIGKALVSRFGK